MSYARSAALCFVSSLTSLFCLIPFAAQAHPLDVAYLDFGVSSTQLNLTVAIHPYQAYELVRGTSKQRFDLGALKQHGDLVSAYVEDKVTVTRGGAPCDWQAQAAQTPDTELDAVADGVTIQGDLVCQSDSMDVMGESTLFLEGYPSQTSILRLDLPEGYAERATLDHATQQGKIDITPLYQSVASTPASASATQKPRRPDASEASLAQRFLDPGLSPWGIVALLFLAIGIGALHALGPGHGKSLLAAMLVGERATVRHMLTLGTVMTVTHVADVFILSIVASFIAVILPPAALLGILEIISAVALVGFGLYGLVQAITRYRMVRHNAEFVLADEAHARAHALGMPHAHAASENRANGSNVPDSDQNAWKRILWMGFVGSLAPCPTAWAIFLGTISAGRPGAGFILLIAFSIGLYATILTIGILLLKSRSFALKHTPPRITYAMPIFSATLVTLLGAIFLIRLIIT